MSQVFCITWHVDFCIFHGLLKQQWRTFTLSTTYFDEQSKGKFQEFVRQHAQVIRSAKALGGWDVVLYMLTSGHREFHKLAYELKSLFSAHTQHYDSWMAYKEHFYKPFPELLTRL